jgi:signal transduction histidine kinase
VDLSLFRVVQEALTNALRHSGRAPTSMVVRYLAAGVEVEVLDDGSATVPATDGGGRGLTGMRERVGLFGGTLEAGPRAGGGFRVHALVPLDGGLVEPG